MSKRSFKRSREHLLERAAKPGGGRARRLAKAAGVVAAGSAVVAPGADAATFTVNTLADPGSGGCDATECTLKEAVFDATTANGADTIVFASGLSGTITVSGLPIHNDSLTIQGPGAGQLTVSGGGVNGIFDLYTFDTPNEEVVISGLTLRDGTGSSGDGGAIRSLAASGDAADLTLSDVVLTGNHATDRGGAIYAHDSAVTILNSQIINNSADNDGGGIWSYYSNLDGSEATGVVIKNTVISDNTAYDEGGGAKLYGAFGDLLLENVTVSGNTAGRTAGGLAFYGNEDGASTTIRNSTVSGNYVGGTVTGTPRGGGIALWGTSSPNVGDPGPVLIENTTISGNRSAEFGAGVYSYNSGDLPRTIRNSTIVDNAANTGGGTAAGGGIYAYLFDNPAAGAGTGGASEDDLVLSSTIVANNTPEDLADNAIGDGEFKLDFDLIETPATATTAETVTGSNLFTTDPQLGPLAANGGPTQTRLPALTSPAIDAGVANGLATDQRGRARTFDFPSVANRTGSDATDIGAVEAQGASCQGAVVFADFPATDGDDALTGTDGPDSISALGGNDTAAAGGANDCVSGGDGNDKTSGQDGKDLVKGDAGKDNLSGGGGKDKVIGGDGKDVVKGGGGADKLKGNAGKDTIKSRGGGKDKVNCGAGKDKAKVDAKDKVAKNCEKVDEK